MRAKLDKHLDARTDRVRIYTICDACVPKIETVDIPEPVEGIGPKARNFSQLCFNSSIALLAPAIA
jgi:hypothetical protein